MHDEKVENDIEKLKLIMNVATQCKLLGQVDDGIIERLALSVGELKHLAKTRNAKEKLQRIQNLLMQQKDIDGAIREMRKLILSFYRGSSW
ncbi:MAG: hypothetical protein OWQ54_04400 [Sulfolobaceae archaeon]|nr:hypothetical protein [Sulfolobaceae archaeon]